jgi:ribosomal protein S18 acetylase RimI-like enzyme
MLELLLSVASSGPKNMPPTVLLLPASQIPPAAALLARAFHDDPFFTFALPDPARRRQVLPWFYEKFLQYGQRFGQVYTTASLAGVAIWLGPQKTSLAFQGALQAGLWQFPLKLHFPEFRRSLLLSNYAGRLHAAAITGPHWYLSELGVEPHLQGQGVGSALLQPILAAAGRQALGCYLETNNEKNLPFYAHHGFGIVNHGHATPAAPSTWAMLRNPI